MDWAVFAYESATCGAHVTHDADGTRAESEIGQVARSGGAR
jgi:hypothetical protein